MYSWGLPGPNAHSHPINYICYVVGRLSMDVSPHISKLTVFH